VALGVDLDPAVDEEADARPGMGVAVRHAAGWEIDPVAPHHPFGVRVELDAAREQRTLGRLRGIVELPDERVPLDVPRAVERGVVRDVVDDAVAARGLGVRLELVEGEPQSGTVSGLSRTPGLRSSGNTALRR
jgi:hypothetical protein